MMTLLPKDLADKLRLLVREAVMREVDYDDTEDEIYTMFKEEKAQLDELFPNLPNRRVR